MTCGRCWLYVCIFSIHKSVHPRPDKRRGNLTVVLRWSRADANQACAASFLQRDTRAYIDFLGFTDRTRARPYKTCAELHKPVCFCTHCCRTFSTRGPLQCLLKISNAGLVLTRYVIIPFCSQVLLYRYYLSTSRCEQGGWWLAEHGAFCICRRAFLAFQCLVWLPDL